MPLALFLNLDIALTNILKFNTTPQLQLPFIIARLIKSSKNNRKNIDNISKKKIFKKCVAEKLLAL